SPGVRRGIPAQACGAVGTGAASRNVVGRAAGPEPRCDDSFASAAAERIRPEGGAAWMPRTEARGRSRVFAGPAERRCLTRAPESEHVARARPPGQPRYETGTRRGPRV